MRIDFRDPGVCYSIGQCSRIRPPTSWGLCESPSAMASDVLWTRQRACLSSPGRTRSAGEPSNSTSAVGSDIAMQCRQRLNQSRPDDRGGVGTRMRCPSGAFAASVWLRHPGLRASLAAIRCPPLLARQTGPGSCAPPAAMSERLAMWCRQRLERAGLAAWWSGRSRTSTTSSARSSRSSSWPDPPLGSPRRSPRHAGSLGGQTAADPSAGTRLAIR